MDRFWSKVTILGYDDCWEWKAGGRGTGYGSIKVDGKAIDSHRMAWFLTYGELPKLLVCHTCDNRLCCNPSHLFLGTYQDNYDDMVSKGRRPSPDEVALVRGEEHWNSALTEKDVIEIREKHKSGKYTTTELSNKYKVTTRTIRSVVARETWKNVL